MELRGRALPRQDRQGAHRERGLRGYAHHASPEEPQYEVKSDKTDKTDHIALHRGEALTNLRN